jgi:hypothetical protein
MKYFNANYHYVDIITLEVNVKIEYVLKIFLAIRTINNIDTKKGVSQDRESASLTSSLCLAKQTSVKYSIRVGNLLPLLNNTECCRYDRRRQPAVPARDANLTPYQKLYCIQQNVGNFLIHSESNGSAEMET